MKKSTLIVATSIAAVGSAVGFLAWHARPQMSLPEPVQARLDALPDVEITNGMTLTPLFGRFGTPMVIAEATAPGTTREELLSHLRVIDQEVRGGVMESDMPDGTSALIVLHSTTDPDLSVTTADLHGSDDDPDGTGTVSDVAALPKDEPAPVGGDAQPQDVSLPER